MNLRRIRLEAPIDRDAASPDSIQAATTYLIGALFERAEREGVALDWGSWRTFVKRRRNGDLTIIQYARVA